MPFIEVKTHPNAGEGLTYLQPKHILKIYEGGDNNAVLIMGNPETYEVKEHFSTKNTVDEVLQMLKASRMAVYRVPKKSNSN